MCILRKACDERNIEFIDIDALAHDYTTIPQLEKGSLFYKVSRGAQRLESLLLKADVITFFTRNPEVWFYSCSTQFAITHEKIGLQQPRTIHSLTSNKILLRKCVEYLEGFPVIITVTGGTTVAGIIKVDSFESLVSVIEYVISTEQEAVLRQYIEFAGSARLTVLENRVVASLEYKKPHDDFPTNAGDALIVTDAKFSTEVEQTAIKSVHSIGVELNGVDIIFDNNGNHYLSEMNFPMGFQSIPKICGVDIGGLMIDHLISKAQL